MDMISQLPESIVHEILGFISTPEELVRMSVLSKTWFDLTASYPVLAFEMSKLNISRASFFKYIEYTTSRFCHQNVPAHAFFFEATSFQEPAEVDFVNKCLELVLKKGVKTLCICVIDILPDVPKYRLPNTLLNVSMLEELLIVRYVHIDDEVIKHLATSCPLLEELYIALCPSVKRLCVHGHQNLKRVHFLSDFPVETIDTEAPNLNDITVIYANGRLAPLMNLASCKQLTTVTFAGNPLSNLNGFNDFLSNFPFIENLILFINCECNNLKFSSHSLRTFVLVSSHFVADIEFNTPNLGLYIGSSVDWNPEDVIEHSPELQACMQSYRSGHGVWFNKLGLFMDKATGFEIISMYIYAQKFTKLEKLKVTERSPNKVNDVVLDL
ncbi:F-box/LRR-repeat protein 25-like [Bidens hawaiensis]|uniref:F-box/LRR-repeat protein 25-like n=1 Tax=Bidens hawaiensis TaxID=980011 RepID=UPI00404B2514